MKKFIVFAAIPFLFIQCFSQKVQPKDVPVGVKAAMEKAFPGITPKWEKEDSNFEASFKKDGHEMSAVFDAKGGILETEMDIPFSALPAGVATYMSEKYKGEKIKESSKITDPKGKIIFEVAIKGKDILFDEKGAFLKEVKE